MIKIAMLKNAMIKPEIMIGFFAMVGVGCVLAPVGVSARSSGAHASAHHSSPAPVLHHRKHRRFFVWGSSYYPYGSSGDENYAPPPVEKPVAQVRRGCEPQSYSVPSADGGESKVTIVRC
jgi:hypothetical protein